MQTFIRTECPMIGEAVPKSKRISHLISALNWFERWYGGEADARRFWSPFDTTYDAGIASLMRFEKAGSR